MHDHWNTFEATQEISRSTPLTPWQPTPPATLAEQRRQTIRNMNSGESVFLKDKLAACGYACNVMLEKPKEEVEVSSVEDYLKAFSEVLAREGSAALGAQCPDDVAEQTLKRLGLSQMVQHDQSEEVSLDVDR